jgi:hypothetical protein
MRQLWRHYYEGTVAVVFVIDSSDIDRLAEARFEIEQMCEDQSLKDWHLLVLANKQVRFIFIFIFIFYFLFFFIILFFLLFFFFF